MSFVFWGLSVTCNKGFSMSFKVVSVALDFPSACEITLAFMVKIDSLQWRHNERNDISNHQPHDCLLNGLFRRRSTKTSKLRVTGLWEGNSSGTGEFPAHKASNAENVSICFYFLKSKTHISGFETFWYVDQLTPFFVNSTAQKWDKWRSWVTHVNRVPRVT